MPPASSSRPYDLLLWGATGFTGQLVAEYLLRHEGVGKAVRWALGGRNAQKLEQVRLALAALDPAARDLPLVLADAHDPHSLQELAGSARVICSTVGPYGRYGSELVAACVASGTHYCDLTGEAPWMAEMIARHHEAAQAAGARIVHACGYDSLPSDLGALLARRALQDRTGRIPPSVRMYVRNTKGGFSGGTVASMMTLMQDQRSSPAVRKIMWDAYSLLPPGAGRGPKDVRDIVPAQFDAAAGAWVAPFFMAPSNAKVVRRTVALQDPQGNVGHSYTEVMHCGPGLRGWMAAQAITAAMGATLLALSTQLGRAVAGPLLPEPGEGPDEDAREAGHFRCDVVARDGNETARVVVRGNRDPGYGATSGMLAEAALCLALDHLQTPCGVVTPAVALGDALIGRLPRAGVTLATDL